MKFVELTLVFLAFGWSLSAELNLEDEPVNAIDQVKVIFFYKNGLISSQAYKLNKTKDILAHPEFDDTRKTLFYISDCYEYNNESVHVIVNAYAKRTDYNVLVLDWFSFNNADFFSVLLPNLNELASLVAENLLKSLNNGLQRDRLHIVGFGLGAQLAGLTGRAVKAKTGGIVEILRISALDPSTNGFNSAASEIEPLVSISDEDAYFVDIIHTDSGFHGQAKGAGHVDFWPNYGHRYQPGCVVANVYNPLLVQNDLCSHKRSFYFWAESVAAKDNTTFLAVSAKNFEDFRRGNLNLSPIAIMGIDCALRTLEGNYYLQTNAIQPYSRGVAGLNHVNSL